MQNAKCKLQIVNYKRQKEEVVNTSSFSLSFPALSFPSYSFPLILFPLILFPLILFPFILLPFILFSFSSGVFFFADCKLKWDICLLIQIRLNDNDSIRDIADFSVLGVDC